MITDNPRARPLPSFELLEMQFFLQCISGMAGAAESSDFWFWDDNTHSSPLAEDDNVSNWGYDTPDDTSLAVDRTIPD